MLYNTRPICRRSAVETVYSPEKLALCNVNGTKEHSKAIPQKKECMKSYD
jgi:hypothetical protein